MIIRYFDILNSIIQSIFFVWITNNIALKENRLSRLKSILLNILILTNICIFSYYINNNSPLTNLVMMIVILCLIILFYRKSIMNAFVGFGISYMYIVATSYIIFILNKLIVENIKLNISIEHKTIAFIYIPSLFFYGMFYLYRNVFFKFGHYLKNLKHSIIIIQIIDYTLLFTDTLQGEWITQELGFIFKVLFIAVFTIGYILISIYFARINEKSKKIEELNKALSDKITELRKLKHEYGSLITILNGLAQNNNLDKIKSILQAAIKQNEEISSTIEIHSNSSPLLLALLKHANSLGINTIIDNNVDIENDIIMDTLELTQIISNIINNSIRAVKNKNSKCVKIITNKEDDFVFIIIENNGDKIPSEYIDKIFEQGFTTKKDKDKDEHGFGLSTCKQIIEKYNGSIIVESNELTTRFIIKMPIK